MIPRTFEKRVERKDKRSAAQKDADLLRTLRAYASGGGFRVRYHDGAARPFIIKAEDTSFAREVGYARREAEVWLGGYLAGRRSKGSGQ